MTSALFKRLNRAKPDRALARQLAPKEARSDRVLYVKKINAFWNIWRGIVKSDLGLRHDAADTGLRSRYSSLVEHAHFDTLLDTISGNAEQRARKYLQKTLGKFRQAAKRADAGATIGHTLRNDFRQRNLRLIKDVGDEQLQKLDALFRNNIGKRHEELAPEVDAILDAGESRAQLIARDQVLKINGEVQQDIQTSAGISQYIWVTSHDERVRQAHRDLDGTTQSWDNPPDTGNGNNHPGQDIQCRCQPMPVIDLFEGV